ncbi:hypothetical protein G7Y89_g5328 [Cudoniella acicularis]|uniref:RING-type domain-containing protein n=1 Tax=Cudoniella acicularis TaxID=354080 RepID=A0A8H4W3G9_9HELO|nr:hypothetical protein G7Y89_g5328 [Cudoniella acicularis]
MKFAHEFKAALIREGFPPHWVESAVPYGQLKKLIKKVANELQSLGLDSATLARLLPDPQPPSQSQSPPQALAAKARLLFNMTLKVIFQQSFHLISNRPYPDPTFIGKETTFHPKLTLIIQNGLAVDAEVSPSTRKYLEDLALRQNGDKSKSSDHPLIGEIFTEEHRSTSRIVKDGQPIQRIEIPLTFDSEFFSRLQDEVAVLDTLQEGEQQALTSEIAALSKEIKDLTKPSKFSKTDLYRWRELFEIYLQAMAFFSTHEIDHGKRDSATAAKKLQWFQSEVVRRGIIESFKLPTSHQAVERFVKINITLLRNIKFQEINHTAVTKILKKFDKRTRLGATQTFPKLIHSGSIMSETMAKAVCFQITQDLVKAVPQFDDYSCPICFSIAWRPVRMKCGHVLCISCAVTLQRKKQRFCPLCRGNVVLEADADEVLQAVLYYLSPRDVLSSVQQVSKRFYSLGSQPLLWRHHCRTQFRYWDSKHRIRPKFVGDVSDVDWKTLYLHRKSIDAGTTRILESILGAQVDRIKKFKMIADFGYDAKDTLLRHCHADDDDEDVLARRYYANAVLDYLHRAEALAEWGKIARGEDIPLERALGSFDLFISELLDSLASRLHVTCTEFDQLSTRKKATAAATFLRTHNLTGIPSELAYRDLQNNYIGIALQDPEHPSLPLVSVAIFCGLAQRLGLDARYCGVPNHVHAMVLPPPNETLDGRQLSQGEEVEAMYLDPYRSDAEISKASLHRMLAAWGVSPLDYSRFLAESNAAALILRTSRNILATVHEFRGHGGSMENTGHPTIRLHANPFADMENAFYSALWANFVFSPSTPTSTGYNQRQFIPLILERFENIYPMDATFIEQYISPLFNNPSNAEHWELREALRVVRAADQTPKQLRLRDTTNSRHGVKYRVGQVFRHRRYAYLAVITGWDLECGMNQDWIADMNVDSLSRGRQQSFYHALVEDTSIRYVAEENIEIVEPEVPISLMGLAGRFFKRWDRTNHTFVSNIRDEYPHD